MLGHGPILDGVVTHVGDMAADHHPPVAEEGRPGETAAGGAGQDQAADASGGSDGERDDDSFGGGDVDPDDVTPRRRFPSRLPGPGPVFDAALIDVPDPVSVLGAVAARLTADAPVVVYCPNLTQVLAVQSSVVGSHASNASDNDSTGGGSSSSDSCTAGAGGSLLWFDSVTETSARRWLVRPPTLRPDPENGAKHGGFLVVLRRDDRLVMHRPKGSKQAQDGAAAPRLFVRGAGGEETPLDVTTWV